MLRTTFVRNKPRTLSNLIRQGKSFIRKDFNLENEQINMSNNIQIITHNMERKNQIKDRINDIMQYRDKLRRLKEERAKERTEWGN